MSAGTPFVMHNAGSGGLVEMRKNFDEDAVQFGLVRMAFGTGEYRRVEWVSVQWSGEDVPEERQAMYLQVESDAKGLLDKPMSMLVQASTVDEVDLTTVINQMITCVATIEL